MADRASPALQICASCAEQTDTNLWCARCHAIYCSRPCQKAHWSASGHKHACAGIARARLDTNLDVQSRALAHVAHMSGGAPGDARCLFCLDRGDAEDPLLWGCACRGTFGWSHMGCLVKMAEAARALPPPEPLFAPWCFCSTCKQHFTGLVRLRLAIALWVKHARAVETNQERLMAAGIYAATLSAAGKHAEAVRLQRGSLVVNTQVAGPEHRLTLRSASNLAVSLSELGECAEAAALLRTTLAVRTRTVGPDEGNTLITEGRLANVLLDLGEYAEAEALGRGSLEKMRRVFGRDHRNTFITSANLASSLSGQGKYAEAVEIQREDLVSMTRLLGGKHEETLISATNLAFSLADSGQKTEAEQLLRDTLVLARRTLGPTHGFTQHILKSMRALGFATR